MKLTWANVEKAAKMSYGDGFCGATIKDLAEFIASKFPELSVNVSAHSDTPCVTYKGTRIRRDFKRRDGLRLEVYKKITEFPLGITRPLLQHDTTDPYRRNWEVARWIIDWRDGKVVH